MDMVSQQVNGVAREKIASLVSTVDFLKEIVTQTNVRFDKNWEKNENDHKLITEKLNRIEDSLLVYITSEERKTKKTISVYHLLAVAIGASLPGIFSIILQLLKSYY